MIRNGSLHGFTPSGLHDPNGDACIAWGIDYQGMGAQHLKFTRSGTLLVDAAQLRAELLASMEAFAVYLATFPAIGEPSRVDAFRVGLWWRFCPEWVDGRTAPLWKF